MPGTRRLAARWCLLLALSCTSDGAPTSDEVEKQFKDFVATANQCTAVSECVLVHTECPLGCFVAVRADRKADVEAKARDLVARYESGGQQCEYECVAAGPLTCSAGRCAAEPEP